MCTHYSSGIKPDYLSKDENIMSETNIRHEKSHAFSGELSKYLEDKGDLLSPQKQSIAIEPANRS